MRGRRQIHFPEITWKILLIAFLDVISICCSYFLALLLRHDFHFSDIEPRFLEGYGSSMGWWCALTLAVFYICRLYHSIWRQVSIAELEMVIKAYLILIPLYLVAVWLTGLQMPRSYYPMGLLRSFICTVGIRFSYRFLRTLRRQWEERMEKPVDRYMVIGGGAAGQMLIKELENSDKLRTRVCCVIDDNPSKRGRLVEGVEIVGNRQDIETMAEKYHITHIAFAIPSCPVAEKRDILKHCNQTGCKLLTIPGMYQLVRNEVSISSLRDVEITDLLGREQVQVNNSEILADIAGKVVLVTGGGGSIGSELCRQIARANPRQLVVFDIYENNAYAIQQELKAALPELELVTLIGSVRDRARVESIFETYRPQVVCHAAAHKHVPLMEDSPNEAVKNNIFGTLNVAQSADRFGAETFVLISTDKAVNPTNVMGASKRVCEMIIQVLSRHSATRFAAVRFGNVLGSNGSVIPLFQQQIQRGGPVTVTHKDIIRYFMTISEAVSLVLQACCYARGGEVFVLDMGEPVRIDDLARNMIRLSGFEPDVDIPIVYTGLRPGEKLFEELLMQDEGLDKTPNELIFIGHFNDFDGQRLMEKLEELRGVAADRHGDIRRVLRELVPTYHPELGGESQPGQN